jgi:hypothetical protein
MADQAEREGGHLPHFHVFVRQQRNERLHTVDETDATDGQRRPAPRSRFPVAEERDQIRRSRRTEHDGRLRGRGLKDRGRRRIGLA